LGQELERVTNLIGDPALRVKSEQRLSNLEARFADIRLLGEDASERYGQRFLRERDDRHRC
jgi:hypothetical protein